MADPEPADAFPSLRPKQPTGTPWCHQLPASWFRQNLRRATFGLGALSLVLAAYFWSELCVLVALLDEALPVGTVEVPAPSELERHLHRFTGYPPRVLAKFLNS